MRRPWLVVVGGVGTAALLASPLALAAGATGKPHSDQVITATKTASDTGAPLAGAVFTLYPWHGTCDLSKPLATATSDSTGKAVFNLEGHHNYCVAETTAPAGYRLTSTGPQVVKTAHSTNGKGADDPANVKESATVVFTDDPVVTPPTTPTTTIPTSPTTPPTAGSGGTTGGSSTGGSSTSGATTVHTGEPWAGSAPYALGAGLAGASMLGAGLLVRRRVLG